MAWRQMKLDTQAEALLGSVAAEAESSHGQMPDPTGTQAGSVNGQTSSPRGSTAAIPERPG